MTNILIRLVQRQGTMQVRQRYAVLSSIVGICCNLLLGAVKFGVGLLAGSVAVTADAVNNIADCASNIVTFTGAKLSGKPDDKEHPFGHGRMEYIASLIVSVFIFAVSFELAKNAIMKMLHPAMLRFSTWQIVLLVMSVFVKLWMAYFNHRLYGLTANINLKAVRQDSLNDCIATVATLLSPLLSKWWHMPAADGVIGLCVAGFILYSGIALLREGISPLLGEAPAGELTQQLETIICESDIVLGVHDIIIHNYGADKRLASADAEVDAQADIFAIHEAIDKAEKRIAAELNMLICIHMDPVDTADMQTNMYKTVLEEILQAYQPCYSFHDFRVVQVNGVPTLHFDLQIPFDEPVENALLYAAIAERIKQRCPEAAVDFQIEHSYI